MDPGLRQIQVADLQRRKFVAPNSATSPQKLAFLSEFYYNYILRCWNQLELRVHIYNNQVKHGTDVPCNKMQYRTT